jgi:hypothetical protein
VKVQRMFYRPQVRMGPDPEKVCLQTLICYREDGSEYFESGLTPEEAEALSLELLIDAKRARAMIESNEFRARKL